MPYRILVTDNIDPEGVALLAAEPELIVDEVPTLPVTELLNRIGEYDAIIGRSATRISPELLTVANRLKVIGRAGVGVDNIALDVATRLGIAVINAPAGNTIAVAELFFGVVLGILRQLPQADASMRLGRWDRATLMGTELKGKTLGVIGLGRIGGEVATRALAFGMEVIAYDPYVTDARFHSLRVHRVHTLDDLLRAAQIVTVHVPLTDETRGMIGQRELGLLSPQSIVVNMARGGIVDEVALTEALRTNQLRAAALDAFTTEPLPADSPLRQIPNLYLTPHMGASTLEAQRNVAIDACVAVRDALLSGELSPSINIAEVGPGGWTTGRPAFELTRKLAAMARAILAAQGVPVANQVEVRAGDRYASARGALLASAAMGVLEAIIEQERLNLINARAVAEGRGIDLSFTEIAPLDAPQAAYTIEVRVRGEMQEIALAGIAYPDVPPRVTRIGAFHVDIHPRGTLLILTNQDVPGVIGRVGTLLGAANANIAEYHQARLAQGGEALAVVSLDSPVSAETREALLRLPDIRSVTVVTFGPT
jgi:D-3-phosphoglycerate dehydrogenase